MGLILDESHPLKTQEHYCLVWRNQTNFKKGMKVFLSEDYNHTQIISIPFYDNEIEKTPKECFYLVKDIKST